jgi:hypothetical protein
VHGAADWEKEEKAMDLGSRSGGTRRGYGFLRWLSNRKGGGGYRTPGLTLLPLVQDVGHSLGPVNQKRDRAIQCLSSFR